MRRRAGALHHLVAVALAAAGCAGDDPLASRVEGVAVAGPWAPSAATRAAAASQRVPVVDPPAVAPLGRCTSTNPFACSCTHPACHAAYPGTAELDAFLRRRFPYLRSGGLYCCRQNSAATSTPTLSVHAIGRAIDLMVPTTGGDADNTLGDPVAAFLVERAVEIGVQRVIWDRAYWNGERGFGLLSSASLPHTDHLHIELSVDGANRRTRFFTSGASSGGATCAARCDGARLVAADCTTRDCAAAGAACLAESPPRCGTPRCPPTGRATVCLDANRILTCADGVATGPAGDCGAYGAFCSTAGATPTTARCTLSLCVGSPDVAPYDHVGCFLVGGERLICRADNTFTRERCPAGQACVLREGGARCEPASPACPLQPEGAPTVDRTVCLDADTLARCYNGNLSDVRPCGASGRCRAVAGGAVCAARVCLAGDDVVRRPVCLGGYIATCAGDGDVGCVQACPAGTRCAPTATGVACVAGDADPGDVEGVAELRSCGVVPEVLDAGTDAGTDAGVVVRDSGSDAGRDAGRDGGAADARRDAGGDVAARDAVVDDAAAGEDAGDAPGDAVVGAACGCRAGSAGGAGAGGAWLAALVAARRRRRRW